MVSDEIDDGIVYRWKNYCLMSLDDDGGDGEYEWRADDADGDDRCLEDVISIEQIDRQTHTQN